MNTDFDLAVIGAGTGGLVSAFVADSLGARVALIEKDRVGGECLWSGCVPSKTLIKSARVYETVKRAEEFGIHIEKPRPIWSAIRLRIAAVRDEIKANEREELAKTKIQVINGTARFSNAQTLEIEESAGARRVTAKKFILATGSSVSIPDIEGLEEVGFLTHEGIFDRPNLARSFIFIGGGPIACEMAQAFARLGVKVTLLQSGERILEKEEPEISALLLKILRNEGIEIHLNARATRVESGEESGKIVHFSTPDGEKTAQGSEIVLATGKTPNFGSLELQNVGVATSEKGVKVDAYGRTTARNIWACGDVTGQFLFTHYAEHAAKIVAQNAMLPVGKKLETRTIPWVTFCDPEVAHLGMTLEQAKKQLGDAKAWTVPFSKLDRAIIEGETSGFASIITTGSGRIVGAHIIGPSAGELIAAFLIPVTNGALLPEFSEMIFPYPTLAEIAHQAGNQWYQATLESKLVQKAIKWLPH